MINIKFSHNQVGMLVEVSRDDGKTWTVVELQKYDLFNSPTYMSCSGVMSTEKQEDAYLHSLWMKGIPYKVVREANRD